MSRASVIQKMQEQGLKKISSILDRRNIPSLRVLIKAGFKKISTFDPVQDLYNI